MLSQRLKTAIEVSGAEGLVSESSAVVMVYVQQFQFPQSSQKYAETLQRPLKTYRSGFTVSGTTSIDEASSNDNYISYSKSEWVLTHTNNTK